MLYDITYDFSMSKMHVQNLKYAGQNEVLQSFRSNPTLSIPPSFSYAKIDGELNRGFSVLSLE